MSEKVRRVTPAATTRAVAPVSGWQRSRLPWLLWGVSIAARRRQRAQDLQQEETDELRRAKKERHR